VGAAGRRKARRSPAVARGRGRSPAAGQASGARQLSPVRNRPAAPGRTLRQPARPIPTTGGHPVAVGDWAGLPNFPAPKSYERPPPERAGGGWGLPTGSRPSGATHGAGHRKMGTVDRSRRHPPAADPATIPYAPARQCAGSAKLPGGWRCPPPARFARPLTTCTHPFAQVSPPTLCAAPPRRTPDVSTQTKTLERDSRCS
jgi:hypothetical protein